MSTQIERIEFTKEMKSEYTILVPDMAPIHFALIKVLFKLYGYNMVILKNDGPSVVEEGLKNVHNDTCYPALLVIGQMIDALNSGDYDLNKTALMISQTGGGCRASNYIHLLRKALKNSGYAHIPVISLNTSNLEKNSGFKITLPMLRKSAMVLAYGDLLMLLNNQVKPYEINKGDSQALVDTWISRLSREFKEKRGFKITDLKKNAIEMIKSFKDIPRNNKEKVKVGIVGEIYVKFSSLGNNNLEEFLYNEDCEVMVPGLMGFIMYIVENSIIDYKLYGTGYIKSKIYKKINQYLGKIEDVVSDAIKEYSNFIAPSSFSHIKSLVKGVIGYGNKMGEGWLLPAEMVELIEKGFDNIICTQPFGCLPNHIVGKGIIRKLKDIYENANIVPIDYDPGATKVNQENRIKLMLSVAKEKLNIDKESDNKEYKFIEDLYMAESIN